MAALGRGGPGLGGADLGLAPVPEPVPHDFTGARGWSLSLLREGLSPVLPHFRVWEACSSQHFCAPPPRGVPAVSVHRECPDRVVCT